MVRGGFFKLLIVEKVRMRGTFDQKQFLPFDRSLAEQWNIENIELFHRVLYKCRQREQSRSTEEAPLRDPFG
jgi:hypothetical protein